MRYLPHFSVLGVFASLPLLVFGAACGGGDDADSKPAAAATTINANAAANFPTTTGANAPAPSSSGTGGGTFKVEDAQTTPSGLKYIDSAPGSGTSPTMQQSVTVHYTGKLASDGKVFDSSVTRGQPATFPMSGVIKGFSEGILTMKPGGKRTVLIPAALAYGANPPPGSGIPANADLIFEIELISVR
jgi:FKBP-type peptidyl-prolyl cis-trans isomerase